MTGVSAASLNYCLAGVDGFIRIECPIHESRRRPVSNNVPGFTFVEVV